MERVATTQTEVKYTEEEPEESRVVQENEQVEEDVLIRSLRPLLRRG